MIPSINPNINPNQNQYLVNNSLVNNILKDIDTSQTYLNKKDDNSLVNNILKDIDTSQTYINKKEIKDQQIENILKDIDTSTIFKNELPSIVKVEEQYPKNLDTIEQIRNYFNTPVRQPQKKYDMNMSNTLYTSNNKPPTPFDGRNPYRRPPSHENNYYNNYINYRDYERDSGRNHQYQNTQKVKAVLNLIEILSPRDLFHLRNDIVNMLRNQNY